MPVSINETRQLLRAWLLADDTINAETAGNVFGAHLSSSDAQTVLDAKPIVVFAFTGGNARVFREFETPTIEVYVYSKASLDDAGRVYDLVYARLSAERIKVDNIGPCGSARETRRPVEGFNEQTAAWFLSARWAFDVIAGPE